MWLIQEFDIFVFIEILIFSMCALLFTFMVQILFKKISMKAQEEKTNSKRAHYRRMISRVTEGEEVEELSQLRKDELMDLRNIIADISSELKGESFHQIQLLYSKLGFEVSDVMQLKSRNTNKKLRALHRLEKLRAEIPYDLHVQLIEDKNALVRLLAMLLFIHNFKREATPKMISFIEQRKYGRKGYLFYILQELGKYDRDALSFLFERINDEVFEEALLISASLSPPPKFDEIIYRKLSRKSAPFVIVWAIRALAHYPSAKFFALINVLKAHPFWAIRLEIVRSLSFFDPSSVAVYVEEFMKDQNYLVRSEATYYAIKNSEHNEGSLRMAIQDEGHPARSIVIYHLSLIDLKKESA